MRLTKQTRNKVYEAIAKSSIDPAECNIQAISYGGVLRHESGSTFEFGFNEDHEVFWAIATVEDGFQRSIDDGWDLDAVLSLIPDWADEINRVARTPDLWAEMRRSREFIADIQHKDSGNAPFTQGEQRQISTLLHEIAHVLAEDFELPSAQLERIEEKLDEAAEASRRMGRKDWLIYFLGTITALIITATVAAGVGEHIFAMVIHGLAHLFTGGDGPPRILT